MRILVTGGAGFIGSHLCDRLLEQGRQVICVDNFFTGSERNVRHLLNNSNFELIKHDIIEPIVIDKRIDQIYNLACPASPVHYQNNPVRTIKANTIGMINILGLARKHSASILQASTSEVYGDPKITPQAEDYRGNVSTIGSRACYDEGKRCAETLCFDYHRMHGIVIKIVRIFNTYGPRMAFDDGRVVSNFIIQAIKDEDLRVDGDGSQTRSFCYVDDLVDGLVKMMSTDKNITGPINLGNPDEQSIKHLAERIVALVGSRSSLSYTGEFREDDPMRRRPDITLAKNILRWEPNVDIDDGLKKTISDFRARLA